MARRKKDRRTPIPVPVDHGERLPIAHDNSELMITEEQVNEAKRSGSKGVGAVVVHHVVTALQILIVLLLSAWAYVTYSNTSFFAPAAGTQRSALEPYAIEGQLLRIEYALSVYYALHEKYPVTLESLVEDGLLDKTDVTYPGDIEHYRYQRFGDGYRLMLAAKPSQESDEGESLIFEE